MGLIEELESRFKAHFTTMHTELVRKVEGIAQTQAKMAVDIAAIKALLEKK